MDVNKYLLWFEASNAIDTSQTIPISSMPQQIPQTTFLLKMVCLRIRLSVSGDIPK
jgi:hypothetical protein